MIILQGINTFFDYLAVVLLQNFNDFNNNPKMLNVPEKQRSYFNYFFVIPSTLFFSF